MDALRVWIERAAKRETSGEDAVRASGILQHRAAWERGNLGGMVAQLTCMNHDCSLSLF